MAAGYSAGSPASPSFPAAATTTTFRWRASWTVHEPGNDRLGHHRRSNHQSSSQENTKEDGCVVLKVKRNGDPAKAIAWDCDNYAQVFDPPDGWDVPGHDEYQAPIPSYLGETVGSKLRNGDYHYVINVDGSLRVVEDDDLERENPMAGHTSLAEGRQVLAAGRFKVAAGEIVEINNFSGHYWPRSDDAFVPVGEVVHTIFGRNGWPFYPNVWEEHR